MPRFQGLSWAALRRDALRWNHIPILEDFYEYACWAQESSKIVVKSKFSSAQFA